MIPGADYIQKTTAGRVGIFPVLARPFRHDLGALHSDGAPPRCMKATAGCHFRR